MRNLTGVGAALRAVFQPVPSDQPLARPASKSIGEAIDRLGKEATELSRAMGAEDFTHAVESLGRRL